MAQTTCPHLVTVDQNYHQGPPVEYPSFENRCSASGESDSLLFPHQATFCLSNGHRLCPLFKAARNATGRAGTRPNPLDWQPVRPASAPQASVAQTAMPQSAASEPDNSPLFDPSGFVTAETPLAVESAVSEAEWLDNRRRWGWIGAGAVFVAVLLFGGLTAAWAGWNFANAQLETRPPGSVSISQPVVTSAPLPATAFVVWTATPLPGAVPVNPPVPQQAEQVAGQESNANFNFPPAVTATPSPTAAPQENIPESNSEAPAIVLQPPDSAFVQVPPAGQVLPNIQVEIPTPRTAPLLDLVINENQAAAVTDTPTTTPTPLGTPVVVFGADAKSLAVNGCTVVRWSVQNVKEVYYENIGVSGTGEKEECIRSGDGLFTLRVILPNGASQVYTTTVAVELPTFTPTPTWTFTPEPVFTPTWTPIPPTATPTPNIRRGVSLAAQGDTARVCAINSNCAIGLLVTNTGEQIDNLSVNKTAGDAWSPLLCRTDGVCGNQVPLVSVGPGNTVFLELRVVIPADASSGQQQSYQFFAVSDGSGSTVFSQSVTVVITAQ